MPSDIQIIPLPLPGLAASQISMDRLDEIHDWLDSQSGDQPVLFMGVKIGQDLHKLGYEGPAESLVRYAIYGMQDVSLAVRMKLTWG